MGTAGDRTDDILRSLGEMGARGSDAIVIVHKQRYLRGRAPEELDALYREGAERVGVPEVPAFGSELDGMVALLDRASRGDVIAVMCHQDRELLDEWLRERGARVDTPAVLRDKVLLAAESVAP
jgi:cyanophycin synthetase